MILTQWEVWLTYSMYLSRDVPDLHRAATALVESRLADVASGSDGFAAFRSGDELKTGHLGVSVTADHQRAQITFPEGASGFVAEGLAQAAMMRFSELRLFDEENPSLPPYVRAQLGECWAYSEAAATRFYPSIKLFENGVILVELRMLSPEEPVGLTPFIDGVVNGYAQPFDRLETGVGLATLMPRAVLMEDFLPFRSRFVVHRVLRRLEAEVKERARVSNSVGFDFEIADVEPEMLRPSTTSEFAQLVASAAAYAVGSPREGADYVLRGPGPMLRVDRPWVGRPHVHLIDFQDQQDGARANEERHGDSLGWIMARHAGGDRDEGRSRLPQSLRQFDDYGVYVNGALTLWVQSKRSIERSMQSRGDQRKLAEVVYEQQAIAEMLDYGYMVHRRFAQTASTMAASTEQVLAAQGDLIRLEAAMGEVGRFGELRDLLESAWATLGVRHLRDTAGRGLAVRQAEAANLEARRVQRWATALAVVLGVGVVPSLANDVLSPTWKWLGFPTPADEGTEAVVFLGAAAAVVTALLRYVYKWALR